MFREGLRSVLASEPDFHVVGQATNGHDALSLVHARKPDLLLLDFEIQDPSAMAVLRQMEGSTTDVRTVLVTETLAEPQMLEALELGAHGVIDDSTAANLVVKCIRTIMKGQYLDRPRVGFKFDRWVETRAT